MLYISPHQLNVHQVRCVRLSYRKRGLRWINPETWFLGTTRCLSPLTSWWLQFNILQHIYIYILITSPLCPHHDMDTFCLANSLCSSFFRFIHILKSWWNHRINLWLGPTRTINLSLIRVINWWLKSIHASHIIKRKYMVKVTVDGWSHCKISRHNYPLTIVN